MNYKITKSVKEENLKRMEICPRFNKCSVNICPLDPKAEERTNVPDEDICPFTIKKRKKSQRGLVTHAPDNIFKVIPESNLKMLSRANQRRWRTLHKGRNS